MFGYDRQDLVGQKIEQLIPERFRGGHGSQREQYFASPHARQMGAGLQLFGRRQDGSEFPVDIMLSSLRASKGPMAIAVVRDITERRRIEEALERPARLSLTGVECQGLCHIHDGAGWSGCHLE